MRILRTAIARAIALLLTASPVAAVARGAIEPAPPGIDTLQLGRSDPEPPLSAEEQEYADFIVANSIDTDPEAVYRSVRYGDKIAETATGLQQRYPESFVEAGLAPDPGSPSVAFFEFAGQAPAEALAEIDGLAFRSELRQGLPFSSQRIQEVQQTAYAAVLASGLVRGSGASADKLTGAISIYVNVASVDAQQLLQGIVDSTVASRFGTGQLPDVQIITQAEPVGELDVLTGGATLSRGTTSLARCTAGFTVEVSSNTSRRGLVTAAHCEDNLGYERRPVLGELLKPKGDLQWHELTSNEGVRNYIIYESGLRTRKVVGYGNPTTGQYICRYGYASQAKCDYVRNSSGNTCNTGYCGLFEMDLEQAEPGDSGGPWWSGSGADAVARGIHQGEYDPVPGAPFDVFTPVALLSSQLGVRVHLG